ncbi:MAG: sugar kinase [Flavobacteriaceae bacterium]|nr:sugar kinase [Flavobacteriaceae bacterium]|tara:strand:+ start:53309 stop:54238 length:930 start_codon:yes stop_codon:yes gene_type:complete
MNKLLIVGTIAFDAIETPFGKTDKIIGGSAPYIALSASKFNVQSAIVSIIGDDFPEENLNFFQSNNINTSAVEIISGGKTFFWSGRYHKDMNTRNTITTDLNVLEKFNPIIPEEYKKTSVVVLGNLAPASQSEVISQLLNPEALIVLDTMNFWMDNAMDELLKVLKRVDVITINEEEARQLTGENSVVLAARKIYKMGPRFVVIKKGEHGVLLFNDENIFSAPAFPLEKVFDPTGAGDTFAGGFAGFLTKTNDFSFENMKLAAIYGSVMASFSVEKFGPECLYNLEAKEIKNRIKAFRNLTQFQIEFTS